MRWWPIWGFATVYGSLMIAVEILLLLAGLTIPRDNATIAAILFTSVPPVAARLTGYRSLRDVLALWALVVPTTLVLSVTLGSVQGLLAPLFLRPLAGLFAAGGLSLLRQKMADEGGHPEG